jgi:hypothetical protein
MGLNWNTKSRIISQMMAPHANILTTPNHSTLDGDISESQPMDKLEPTSVNT